MLRSKGYVLGRLDNRLLWTHNNLLSHSGPAYATHALRVRRTDAKVPAFKSKEIAAVTGGAIDSNEGDLDRG
jgi:hypothetical protein